MSSVYVCAFEICVCKDKSRNARVFLLYNVALRVKN